MREREEENAKLKKVYANGSLENNAIEGLVAKGLVTVEKHECVSIGTVKGLGSVKCTNLY